MREWILPLVCECGGWILVSSRKASQADGAGHVRQEGGAHHGQADQARNSCDQVQEKSEGRIFHDQQKIGSFLGSKTFHKIPPMSIENNLSIRSQNLKSQNVVFYPILFFSSDKAENVRG